MKHLIFLWFLCGYICLAKCARADEVRDEQLHFAGAAALTFGSTMVFERMKLPAPYLWSFVLVSGVAYVKEKSDPVFGHRDLRAGVAGSAMASFFTVVIKF